ncbi:MAG TPA: glutamate-1-semialdehyde-2,1-aminomutase [Candidatus Marinimicrobia bacterium]|nr:MAG: glutamate-1-semialdehyde-2,1-aminomutase [Candidatus Marinimicrobia bacterium CG1_02_48_14]PIZ70447.1 MAG: glutamate-1-semialdehyde-2,1-aminomutase [Candidatus Marinimicrobia bacterium CG_4_10_14_0_2_um_filter_48_9]PJA51474.1 MAG: glutamate-1-semialdehyde-2,1-aminomutase [Candidatus Marinimicrobia bacterium CG_4_9_14_3_um_filter_48_9]HCW75469.1 glutamate-1-semialdehyde-2,1-aminomutase [Candidatus Neomarinimicrobiota bacterium]
MSINFEKSQSLFNRAQQTIPGGVNSPVRAFKGVGGTPPFITKGQGPYIFDADGNRFVDFVGSWGPLILGHAHPEIITAIQKIAQKGTSFGAPTELEIELAEMIVERVPSAEMVRLVNSGTEATMSAVRVARGVTGRDKMVKFDGCYHGHGDSFLIAAGSGALTLGEPNSPGVTKGTAADTLLAQFNDIESVKTLFQNNPDQIACVIVEPINGNTGCIPPQNDFLLQLREVCSANGALLILDEVMTGFRVARGGANELYGVDADLLTFGKVIGGGMPIGAYGGKREFMEQVSPVGPIYQAGTLSGNPVAVTAGIETLKRLDKLAYDKLESLSAYWSNGLQTIIGKNGYPLTQHRVGSMFTLFFTDHSIRNTQDVAHCDIHQFNRWFHGMLENGVYLAPSQYEAGFMSLAHTYEILDETLAKAEAVLGEIF